MCPKNVISVDGITKPQWYRITKPQFQLIYSIYSKLTTETHAQANLLKSSQNTGLNFIEYITYIMLIYGLTDSYTRYV